jgi:hypothetical protein
MNTPTEVKPTHWRFKNLVGQVFGRLTVVSYAGKYPASRTSQWNCRCECGVATVVDSTRLKNGATKSCGCLQRELLGERAKTHGLSRSPEYRVWKKMRSRCGNPGEKQYADYGGRGITVCDRWQGGNGFANFISDMGRRPSAKHQIDRRDNDGPYNPENCRWATAAIQRRNCRPHHLHLVELNGTSMCLTDAAQLLGMTRKRLRRKLSAGVPIQLISLEQQQSRAGNLPACPSQDSTNTAQQAHT